MKERVKQHKVIEYFVPFKVKKAVEIKNVMDTAKGTLDLMTG